MQKRLKPLNSSADLYFEDSETLNQVLTDKSLSSKKEALHIIFNSYRDPQSAEQADESCKYLFGSFCLRNMKIEKKQLPKTTPIYCQACLKAQKLAEDDREIEQIRQLDEQYARDETCRKEKAFFEFLGVPVNKYHDSLSWISISYKILEKRDAEIAELKKPIEEKLTEIANLKAELQKLAPLENDNAFLKQELEKLKHEPLAEKNAWQTVEIQQKNSEIAKLNAEIAKQEATIKAYMFQRGTQ